ncbi:EAL domain-containing protein [Aeromicrobium sp. UC242_57]|uniref:EAL domain-containing protein n=1 Tax=Aeromicrobium sp. UC242_57 TaxID=3374624 RepID=UPI0037A6995B
MDRILRDADPNADPQLTARSDPDVAVGYSPILDVARGSPAGYQAVALDGPATSRDNTVAIIRAALSAFWQLPTNTFISIPIPLHRLGDPLVRDALRQHGDLAGIVLDITDFTPTISPATEVALDDVRAAGALLSVGGRETAQPELGSIIRLRPSIVRLGHAWIADLDQSATKRTAIEVTGRLTAQLDAWILAEAVSTGAELRALSELGVPLAQGPFIGQAQSVWADIDEATIRVLPHAPSASDGQLRALLRQAYTTTDQAAAEHVLPEASGYESVVVIDDTRRPVSLLTRGTFGRWEPTAVLTIHVDTPVAEAVSRAMSRPPETRFLPLVCTDAAGRFLGILKIEDVVTHLTGA